MTRNAAPDVAIRSRSQNYFERCELALEMRERGASTAKVADTLGVTMRSAQQMFYVARAHQRGTPPKPKPKPAPAVDRAPEKPGLPEASSKPVLPKASSKPTVPWHAPAEVLRRKGWSVSGIARHLNLPEATIAAHFGVVWGGKG